MTRIVDWMTTMVRDPDPREYEVHFHSGPAARPVACHDARCAVPRLEVPAGR